MKKKHRKLTNTDVSKKHLSKMMELSAHAPDNIYYKEQVRKTENILQRC